MATGSITLGADTLTVLSNQEKANNGGFTHKITIGYADCAASALTGTTDVLTAIFPIGTGTDFFVEKAVANVTEAFAGSGGLAMEVGTDGDPNNFITTVSILTAGPKVLAAGGIVPTLAGSFAAAADVLTATLTNSVSGSISALSAGSVDVFLALRDLNKIG
jgi:hypothetical protein